MSSADYRADTGTGVRTTAGWFILGSPILIFFGIGMGLVFWALARLRGYLISWISLILLFGVLISLTIRATTPAARLRSALEIEIPDDVQLVRIRVSDSFNEGIFQSGVCTADRAFVDQLVGVHGLVSHGPVDRVPLPKAFKEISFSEDAIKFANDEFELYFDPVNSLMYFSRDEGG